VKSLFIDDQEVPVIYTSGENLAVYPILTDIQVFIADESDRAHAAYERMWAYFWWYRYLLLNERYALYCETRQGDEYCAAFFAHWGDVFETPFPDWWQNFGRKLVGGVYRPEVIDFELLHWAYEAYIGKGATGLIDADVGHLIGHEQPESRKVMHRPDDYSRKQDMERRIGDLKRFARQIISAALDPGRFPMYQRRRDYQLIRPRG
jgi:hypothetical protein